MSQKNSIKRYFQFFILFGLLAGQSIFLPLVQAEPGDVSPNDEVSSFGVEDSPLRAGEPKLILTKTVDDNVSTVQVGDTIRYRIRWECSSLTTSCGEMEINDILQNGLEYLPPPNSSVPSGFDISYAPGTRTVTITKNDDDLIDGTQYDAVIVVRVASDFRPLPATIDNEVTGWIDPPGPVGQQISIPASAPPITIGAVSPSWALSKVRVAPVIEPAVDTEVTYRLRLCPITPPSGGIADLSGIVITDTLPPNVVFVSASDGGTKSGGIVTWPTITGPLSPPNCVERYITLIYPSPAYSTNDTLTNLASVTASYVDSGNNPCPGCFAPPPTDLTHDIIPIQDVPTYSKTDTGDPVGITGTARFNLNLNTNATNYPSNDVTLIDDLPPQLQVTSITSGEWSSSFSNVRAYVEYSTDNSSSWVTLPGQPVSYNTGATYTTGAPANLPDNITNVRWRFEYFDDVSASYLPGLPYVWQFTTQPQIRVTPRATATTADDGASLPAAVVGATYDNCVYLTRTNSGGPVTDTCSTEDMTVQGDYVSLNVSKAETPGASWDSVEDPLINTFTSDTTILPGDTLRYVLTVDMTERSSEPLVDPTILDTLPEDLIFVRAGDVLLNDAALPPGASVNFSQSGPNPGVGNTLLWEFSGLTVNENVLGSNILTVEFFARIPSGQIHGTRTNTIQVATDSTDVRCETGTTVTDSSDIDGDDPTIENTCRATDVYIVDRSAALRGEKWIRSVDALNSVVVNKDTFAPDATCPDGGITGLPGSSNSFTRYPCISQAYPEGALNPGQFSSPPPGDATLDDFEYQLRIFNDGNVPMLNYVLYDILPYYGDRGSGGTLESTPRASEFRPVMTGPLTFLGGAGLNPLDSPFTIEYNLTTNPCRPEVFNQPTGSSNVPAGCNNTWDDGSGITDWSTVRSYRIILKSGLTIAPYVEGDPTNIVRFGMLMSIPKDSPIVGSFNNDDAQTREIAWNSFAHVGSYLDPIFNVRDLLASEPRKVGITIPERFSIGNRVWRDSDNSGTINAPDDTNPGIENVLVNLYADVNGDGIPDGAAIASTLTDSSGYYLFSNLPEGQYVVGIPASNFATSSDPLYGLRSSTGTPSSATYTNPPDGNPDSNDHGIDSAAILPAPSTEVFSATITLSSNAEQKNESDLSDNDRDGPAATRRGLNGESDGNSDLTVDFGFFGGSDVAFSIGNYLWYDDGTGGGPGNLNNGIRDAGELPVAGARVELYRDGNGSGTAEGNEYIRFDVTDSNGFYLFDNLDPGTYFVLVAPGNFQDTFDPDGAGSMPSANGVLRGWYSSHPTGTETSNVNGGTTTAEIDVDDNGENTDTPEVQGVFSGPIVLTRDIAFPEPSGETHLSNQPDPDSNPATLNLGINPTEYDGVNSRGRYLETDATSNLTIDFGFIPPMSLGNRVWFDSGAGETTFRSGFNNGIQDGTEPGVSGVRVELWRDTNGTPGLQVGGATPDTYIRFEETDASGYYLFDNIQPGTDYYIHIPASNFASGQPLRNYISSTDATQATAPSDDLEDKDDNGVDNSNPAANGISSTVITMAYGTEPQTPANETDLSSNTALYGTNNVGLYGQTDTNSNLTMDFGFIRRPRSLGNYLWFDTGAGANTNNGVFDTADETPVANALVRLYLDNNNDGSPDDLGVLGDTTDDWVAWDVTDSNGYYLFDNLPPNRYIIGVDADNFDAGGTYFALTGYTSSTDHVDNAANNTDRLDNGIDRLNPTPTGSPYGIISTTVNFSGATLSGVPTGETGSGDTTTALGFNPTAGDGPNSRGRYGEADNYSDLTLDFGFVETYALGNRVWFDTDNDSLMVPGEVGVSGVEVALYHADAGGNPTTPVIANGAPRTTTTNANGYYLFDYLAPGDYVVVITAANFNAGGPLNGYWSSATSMQADGTTTETAAPDPDLGPDGLVGGGDDDKDLDDNGALQTGGALVGAVISPAVTLGPNGLTEPAAETDLNGGSQGDQPDGRANMTVDFGFYRTEIGNLVFNDLDKDGTFNNSDTPIQGATVHLYASNAAGTITTALDTTTTDVNGHYSFIGWPAGSYIVSVEISSGASSTRDDFDANDSASPDWNTDDNDNGVGVGNGEVFSNVLTMTAGGGAKPDTSAKTNIQTLNANGTTTDNTVDFGIVTTVYALGNRVWFDTDNDSNITPGEVGVNGVLVELYAASDLSTVLSTDTTTNGGYYLFDNLAAGDYVVAVAASNFNSGGALYGYWSSATSLQADGSITETAAPDPDLGPDGSAGGGDDDKDSDDNGTLNGGRVLSLAVTLGPDNSEPTGEPDLETGVGQGSNPDARANMTVDFGFYRVSVGNLVFIDVDGSGDYNSGDALLADAIVQLYASDGVTEITVGSGTMTTLIDGQYIFTGLPSGDYIVKVTPPVGYISTVDTFDAVDTTTPDTNTNDNDNGVGENYGATYSNAVPLTPGSAGAKTENTITNGTGTTHNPTVDFGFRSDNGMSKAIITTSEAHTTGSDVTIGEIVTYRISISLPLGIALTDVKVTDVMDKGLAFVDCSSVMVAGVDMTASVCPAPPPTPPASPVVSAVVNAGDSPTNPANPGRQVEFSLGDISAQTTPQTIVIQYRAVVLNVVENVNDVTLNNSVTWSSSGGSFETSAPNVRVIEPDMAILKTASVTQNVPLGTPIDFTLVINHTSPASRADAFDVVVRDIIPATLQYVECSVQYTAGLAPDTPAADYCNPGATTTDLVFSWATFPIGQTSTITFTAVLLNSPATNAANVEWTSLEIDPDILTGNPIERSVYNSLSTERWYDPLSGLDIYNNSSAITINPINVNDGDSDGILKKMPSTGFAPGKVTLLPEQTEAQAYSQFGDIWLEIPALNVKQPIVGVPQLNGEWDVKWLENNIGWLNGTAFPSWEGNSVLTAHVTNASGLDGPFSDLKQLVYGDQIIVHMNGSKYIFEVRKQKLVHPDTTAYAFESLKDHSYLTLITCQTYNPSNDTYLFRRLVRAVLVRVEDE